MYGLGVSRETRIASPTFTLINEYRGGEGGAPAYHVDLYRLDSDATWDDFERIGWDEAMGGDGVTVIEWADRLGDLIGPAAVRVDIEVVDETRRGFIFQTDDARLGKLTLDIVRGEQD